MIKEIKLTCDYIKQVDSRLHDNQIKVTLENINNDFIADLEPEDIVYGQDVTALLEAIGADVVGEWFMKFGNICKIDILKRRNRMISKELLDSVYEGSGVDSEKTLSSFDSRTPEFTYFDVYGNESVENVHELAHMVKEWAWNEGYKISTEKTLNSGWESKLFYLDSDAVGDDVYGEDGYITSFYTNSNGINSDFQAGEWILEQTKQV